MQVAAFGPSPAICLSISDCQKENWRLDPQAGSDQRRPLGNRAPPLILWHVAKQLRTPHNSCKDRVGHPLRESDRQLCRDRVNRSSSPRQHSLDNLFRICQQKAPGRGAVEGGVRFRSNKHTSAWLRTNSWPSPTARVVETLKRTDILSWVFQSSSRFLKYK